MTCDKLFVFEASKKSMNIHDADVAEKLLKRLTKPH